MRVFFCNSFYYIYLPLVCSCMYVGTDICRGQRTTHEGGCEGEFTSSTMYPQNQTDSGLQLTLMSHLASTHWLLQASVNVAICCSHAKKLNQVSSTS